MGGEFKGTAYKNIPPTASQIDSIRIRAQDDSIIRARNFNRRMSVMPAHQNSPALEY